MRKEELLEELANAVISGNKNKAIELAELSLKENVNPYDSIVNGLAKGMEIMGKRYEEKKAFIPHLLMASNAMYGGMDILTPHMKSDNSTERYTLVIGTAEGDVHDIGKNLVKAMMSASGFDIIDLGKDVPINSFVDTAIEKKADVVSISTLMTSTMDSMRDSVKSFFDKGIKDKVKIIVGGAPVNDKFANDIGADMSKPDASEAARWAKEVASTLDKNRW